MGMYFKHLRDVLHFHQPTIIVFGCLEDPCHNLPYTPSPPRAEVSRTVGSGQVSSARHAHEHTYISRVCLLSVYILRDMTKA